MKDDVEDRLKRILVEQLAYPLSADRIRASTSLYGKGLGLDSLDVVSLVVKLEEAFEVFFEAEEVTASVRTFGSLLAIIREKIGQNGAGR